MDTIVEVCEAREIDVKADDDNIESITEIE